MIITETSIRSDLHLEDAGGTDSLPTATIFEELATDLVRLTFGSIGPFYSINIVPVIRFTMLASSHYRNVSKQTTRLETWSGGQVEKSGCQVCVDDIVTSENNPVETNELKQFLSSKFMIKDLGVLNGMIIRVVVVLMDDIVHVVGYSIDVTIFDCILWLNELQIEKKADFSEKGRGVGFGGVSENRVMIGVKVLGVRQAIRFAAMSDVRFSRLLNSLHYGETKHLTKYGNKAMAFLSVMASRFPPLNNQLRTSSNPRNQETIQDGRITVQQVQRRQTQSYAGTRNRGIATTSKGNYTAGQPRVIKCYNFEDCDDLSLAKAVLIANLSSYNPKVLSEYSEQTHIDDFQDNEIHIDSNIILYSQYLQESQDVVIKDTNSSAPNDLLVLSLVEQMIDHVAHLDKENLTNKMVNESLTAELERYKERVTIFEQILNVDLNKRKKLIDSQMDDLIRDKNSKLAVFQQEIDTLKQTLSNNVKEKESLSKTLTVSKQNLKKKSLNTLTRKFIIAKEHAVISVTDDEETLILEEESRSKMLDKQNDPISVEKKIKISPIDSSKLNKIKEDFAPSELPKVSLVNESLKKIKYQLANFDNVVKKITTSDAITADEITEFQTVFNQMEVAVDQCSVDKNAFEIQIKQLSIDNDQLLKQIMSQEIVHIVVNSVDCCDVKKSCVNKCNKCLELETELLKKKDLIEKLFTINF
ncbi:hypothetical protein Tco_1122365 [Tanacetum coccineum]|uniref:Uncharacterized protein n=1 Tax=Tanacetum coccineum TaxID=301880 RepID=A0ABQ5J1S2_9ASTR